ncbi:MAG: hypothetical protein DME26_21330 [Verrucomicrobia bacterium]|nr:MAG: hypothetical protein DME26_21330 [Verrucomicrobiota bacterium]
MPLTADNILARTGVRSKYRSVLRISIMLLVAPSILLAQSTIRHPHPEIPTSVSFRNDVMAVLSKAGCSAGTCHGNKNGKGGFQLSLRGQDPDIDYLTLTRDLFARRIDPLDPEQSLILMKATTQIAHEGGLRFQMESEEYEVLRRWITKGMPNDLASAPKLERIEITPQEKVLIEPASQVQLQVQAKFADGATRDVTTLAVYEPANGLAKVSHDGLVRRQNAGETTVLVRYLHCQEPVRLAFVPARPGFAWTKMPVNNYIDEHIFAKLQRLRMNPSELCSDQVFIRRAYLDLLGILPTAEEARAFVSESSGSGRRKEAPSSKSEIRNLKSDTGRNVTSVAIEKNTFAKRSRLIDQLLERPEFTDFWALKWADLLRVEAHSLDQKGVQNFHHWIRQSIAENKPLDRFVRELITARGSTYSSPAANFYRPNRDPVTRGRAVAQVFLGTRLQCAECHNHPSDRWTQNDYYDWASLFARVGYKVIENNREIGSDQHEWKGEQIVFIARDGAVKNPRTSKEAQPRFLGMNSPANASARAHELNQSLQSAGGTSGSANNADNQDDLKELAVWLTSPTNTLFARVQVNRIWYQLMGRGLVDPPDDFRATNPASHPALLEALAQDLVTHKFDVRHLIRLIMNARAYQLASEPNDTNAGDEMNYSHALIRRLSAEQLLDCQSQVTGVPLRFAGFPVGMRAAQLPGVRPESKGKRRANQWDQFLEIFGKPPRLLTTDTERSCECNMGQAFQMISGPTINELLAEKMNRVSRLLAANKSNTEIIEELFSTALTRAPKPEELKNLLPGLESAHDRRAELEDIVWGLLNSKDFVFRR